MRATPATTSTTTVAARRRVRAEPCGSTRCSPRPARLVILEPADAGQRRDHLRGARHARRHPGRAVLLRARARTSTATTSPPAAAAAGAAALLVERTVDDAAAAAARAARCATRWARSPTRSGATRPRRSPWSASPARAARRPPPTCSHSIFEAHGWSSSVLGTLSGPRTTPEAPELQAHLAAERDAGRQADRDGGVVARAGDGPGARPPGSRWRCSRTSSHDHLDFHRDLEDYFEAKATLFTARYTDAAVVNLDDPRGVELARREHGADRRATPSPTPRTSSVGTTSCSLPVARPRRSRCRSAAAST